MPPPERCVGLGGARLRLILERICCRKDALKSSLLGADAAKFARSSGFGRDKFLRRHRYFRAHLSARQIFSKTIMRTILAKIATFYAIYLLFSKF